MALSPRSCAVAFGQDLAQFLAWSVIPLWAREVAHASPRELGLLSVPGGITYILLSVASGRLSDRVSRSTLARIGCVLFAAFCVLAWRAKGVSWIYLVSPLGGLGTAMIWPGLQALVADESRPEDLEKNLGTFSLSWSAGKSLGFFLCGFAWQALRIDALLVCAAVSLVLAPLIPGRPAGHRATEAPLVRHDGPTPAVRCAYLRAAWLANFATYGLGATLNFLYEDLVLSAGRPHHDYSNTLGVLFLSQTFAFWIFGHRSGWRYRPGAFLFWQLAGAAGLVVIGLGAALPLALAAAVVSGAGLGLAYTASIYYSVHSDEARGARAGIHEAVIGASTFLVPMLGGFAQHSSGRTWAPYALSAGIVLTLLVAQAAMLVRKRA